METTDKPDWIDTYTLPSVYASALVNDDWSGLDKEGREELIKWLDETRPGYCFGISDGDSWFSWGNDMNSLGADVCEYYFDNRVRGEG
jgi:hypothetical protein